MNFAPNGHLKGHLGIEKAQLILLVEAILRPFWDYDELEYKNPNHPLPLFLKRGPIPSNSTPNSPPFEGGGGGG